MATTSTAWAQCPPAPPPQWIVEVVDPVPVWGNTTTSRDLAPESPGPSQVHRMGITHVESMLESKFHIQHTAPQNGQVCAYLHDVQLIFGHKALSITIASEIPPGSCTFQDVLTHEYRHVDVLRDVLQKAAVILRNDMAELFNQPMRSLFDSTDAAKAYFQYQLAQARKRAALWYVQESERRNRDIDTPQEYHRASLACQGEAQHILRSLP